MNRSRPSLIAQISSYIASSNPLIDYGTATACYRAPITTVVQGNPAALDLSAVGLLNAAGTCALVTSIMIAM